MNISRRRIVAIPVDPRPVVRAQVMQLAALAEVDLVVPPVDMLGHFRVGADRDALLDWLAREAPSAEAVILSLDMLLYGGLVPSRFIEDTQAELLARLNRILTLRARFPAQRWSAFIATMRISNNNVAEEEKTYWSEYGEAIWQWSYQSDRAAQTKDSDAQLLAESARLRISDAIRDDYLATRARNFLLVKAVCAAVEEGGFDRLILPQDDTAAFGFNIAERRELLAWVLERGMQERVAIYAGADEVLHTLLAHAVGKADGAPALRVRLAFTDPAGAQVMTARYEDRPLLEALQAQAAACGIALVEDNSDVIVMVHTAGEVQGDWAMKLPNPCALSDKMPWNRPSGKEFASFLQKLGDTGEPLALIDLAYANGGDPQFVSALAANIPLRKLVAYAGWNTASNAIGSLFAQLVLARHRWNSSHNRKVLAARFLEDLVYQADVRQRVRASIDEATADAETLARTVGSAFAPVANAWCAAHDFPYTVQDITLPWDRTFEIGFSLDEYPRAQGVEASLGDD